MNYIKLKLKKLFSKRSYSPIRLTMKAIIRWEQLNNKSFPELDYGSENEVLSLFYACTLSNAKGTSLEEFKKNLSEKDVKIMAKDFERQAFLTSQFQTLAKSKKKSDASEDSTPMYIRGIVGTLVMNGLDVHFAMNEMELCDLPIFIQAHDQKVKDGLEASRLWTFLQLLPHLSKSIKSPKELHPFAWEMEEEHVSESQLEEGKNEFQSFLEKGLTT